ncbi:hypothetical protein BDV25DRAFT_128612 [Aspergillus avenaceus]|uniref:Zn(2)-C6 fungal-type domain-containing protein n=1 Tax=Aspergillus avenaceus TaxID=36643 RepID=A0A5N6TZ65_ASPAV|nr:hypothetical protein BDV25DRAFT_128612 [Aspergillus avenaceus]
MTTSNQEDRIHSTVELYERTSSAIQPRQIKPPRIKRPHTKSRNGCLNCKARRVKCQETRPHPCTNCVSRKMLCLYPARQKILQGGSGASRNDSHRGPQPPATPLRSQSEITPHAFSGDDLRFFHHFLTIAYPHLPFGSEILWKTFIPASAHECPHLLHAILSLGATHLSLIVPTGSKYTTQAVTHRGKAMKALGNALARGDQCSTTDLELMLATAYALTFQANYMTDGLLDFAVMVRGCAVITRKILNKHTESDMFKLLSPEAITNNVISQIPLTRYADPGALITSIETLELIQPLLVNGCHKTTYQALLSCYQGMQRSAREGFIGLTGIYMSWEQMEHQEFMEFLDEENHVSRALFLHYITIQIMMRPVFYLLRAPRPCEFAKDELPMHQWASRIYGCLPSPVRELVEWQARSTEPLRGEYESGTINH